MRIIGYEPQFKAPTKLHVEKWYFRDYRCWVVQTKDSEGNQVGFAAYVASRREADLEVMRREADLERSN